MVPKSYQLHPNVVLETTRQRYFDVHYSQSYLHLNGLGPNATLIDIPVGPPWPRVFQIFQIRMTSESKRCEWSLHTRPYAECSMVDFVFKCLTDQQDEMLQETWLIVNAKRAIQPYLFFTFKELAGENPGNSRLEIRVAH